MAIDWNLNSKEQVYLSFRKILWPDHPRTIQALKDFESQQKLDSFNKPKVTTTSVEQPVGNVSAITSYNNRLNDLILQWDASTERQVQQTQADQKKLKEWIIRSQTGKWFLSVGANSAWAWTPAWQTIAALDLINNETDSKLATVDANANNIIAQTRQQNTAARNAIWQQQAVWWLSYATNKEQLDFQKKQYEDALAKQKAASSKKSVATTWATAKPLIDQRETDSNIMKNKLVKEWIIEDKPNFVYEPNYLNSVYKKYLSSKKIKKTWAQ